MRPPLGTSCPVHDMDSGFGVYVHLRKPTSWLQAAGYEGKVKIGMDVAASEFMTEDKKYDLNFKVKDNDGSQVLSGCGLLHVIILLCPVSCLAR